jgi:predicted metalloprotease
VNSPRSLLLALAALVLALAVLAGCGDDDDDGGDGDGGTPTVQVNETATVSVDPADESATEDPSQDQDAVFDEMPELRRATGEPSVPAIRGSAGLTVPEWIALVNSDVANYWQVQFNNAGYRYTPATENIFDRRIRTGCGRAGADAGPFYCGRDDGIYLPVRFFEQMAQRFGDAAVAVVIAHEEGHHVQDLIGLFQQPLLSAQIELQADCLAGVWAATVYERGLIEPGDIEEILGIVDLAGDAEGVPIEAEGAHGSSALRLGAFQQGYQGGQPNACPVPRKRDLRNA